MGNLGPVMHVHQRNGLLDMKHLGALPKVINIVNTIHVLFRMMMMMMMMMRIDVPRRCSGWALCRVLTVCTLDRDVDSASLSLHYISGGERRNEVASYTMHVFSGLI